MKKGKEKEKEKERDENEEQSNSVPSSSSIRPTFEIFSFFTSSRLKRKTSNEQNTLKEPKKGVKEYSKPKFLRSQSSTTESLTNESSAAESPMKKPTKPSRSASTPNTNHQLGELTFSNQPFFHQAPAPPSSPFRVSSLASFLKCKSNPLVIALLGTGESGKSTMYKQFSWHFEALDPKILQSFQDVIWANTLQSIQRLITGVQEHGIFLNDPKLEV